MIAFRDLSVRHKQLLAAVAVVVAALAVVISAFIAATFGYMRAGAEADLEAQSEIVAATVSTALEFNDPQTASDTLRPLTALPTIDFACVYARDGKVFAHDVRAGTGFQCPPTSAGRRVVTLSYVLLEREVRQSSSTLGSVVIQRNLSDVHETVRFQLLVTVVALVLAIGSAAAVALPIHRSIASPIVHLADIARQVSQRGDYSIRARKQGNDEVGQLVDTFNQMLTDIAQRDRDLSVAAMERTRLLEREKEANRVKDEFLAALSHELRTPLNAIAGWIQILQKAPPTRETLTRALASIERNAHAQGRLIEDLLDISRIVSGKLNLKTEAADLGRIVESATDVARGAASKKGIALSSEVPREPCFVSGDADRLQQVVWNLLSNAIKFTPAGGRVSVTLEGHGTVYTVQVTDTGIGIDAGFLPYVFDRFRQADGSVTREHGGLGLGLAIAREILDLHGGRIEAHSEGRGHGSRFVLELPALLSRDLADQTGRTAPGPLEGVSRIDNLRALVVEDDDDAREIATQALTGAGAAVVSCANAAAALEMLGREHFDVLICDLALPYMDGYSLLQIIRKDDHPGALLPAVALSAYTSAADRQRSAEAGFQVHVAKPFQIAVLVDAIKTAILAQAERRASRT